MTAVWEPEPELTPDEELMLEIGWLDLWHADREAARVDGEPGESG